MLEAVFVSDVHLTVDKPQITKRFLHFLQWARINTRHLYILGDLFEVWVGDDALTSFHQAIQNALHELAEAGVLVYYLHGNRDFLLGADFAKGAKMQLLDDPCRLTLRGWDVLLTHGDQYCIFDHKHQRFRRLTRNRAFSRLFLCIPVKTRRALADRVRQKSMMRNDLTLQQMDVDWTPIIEDLKAHQVDTVIHGHTHRPGLSLRDANGIVYRRFVLSDWDDRIHLLCYNSTSELFYKQIDFGAGV